MSTKIQVDTDEMARAGDRFDDAGDFHSRENKNFAIVFERLRGAWAGEAGVSFQGNAAQWLANYTDVIDALYQMRETLGGSEKSYRETELTNSSGGLDLS
ncbi:WXG100 family type VII secretion target [Salinispora tropica]|uniref:WXG100 family type VII secretion target n=1 Tax=Salinispora tropica TaxID=168695 RepID=UPI00164F074C|nr:WXG100 family type VII secretion target [Salinispora tropica]